MTQLVGFSVGDDADHVFVVEVEQDELPDELVPAGHGGPGSVGRAAVSLEQALQTLRPALERVATLATSLAPDEATVEIGLKLGGETGVIVAKGTAEANLKLKLTWKSG